MDSTVKLRTFLALPLSQAFQTDVAPLIEKLKQNYPQVRWVKPAEIHVTLHFFGSMAADEIPRISAQVTPVTQQARPVEVFLKGVGGFPHLGRPRVIWVGIEGATENLKMLQGKIEQNLKKAGFPCEEREFKPHLTLGRVREGKKVAGLERVEFGPTASKRVGELVLFQSHLSPQGAHYEPIATYPLSAP